MRPSVWVLALGLFLGCGSDPVSGPSTDAPAPDEAPGTPVDPTGTAPEPALKGFAPIEVYPEGPYGHGVGALIENLTFLGWRDPVGAGYDSSRLQPVSLAQFYDPEGIENELIVLNASAVWCTVCQRELRDMNSNGTYAAYRTRGVEVVGTLFQNVNGGPAAPSDLELWGASPVRSIAFPLLLDPGLKMGVYFTSDATPLNLLIDARSMRILSVMMGYDASALTGLWGIVERELGRRGR